MHLFLMDTITNHANSLIETNTVLVVAESHEQAYDLICRQLNLPPTRTRVISGVKVKPPIHVVKNRQSYPTTKVSMRTQRDEPLAPVQRYHIIVDAATHGQNEQQVLRKIGEELQARGAQTKLRHNIPMKIECETVEPKERRMGPLEKVEFFRPNPVHNRAPSGMNSKERKG